MQSTGGSDVGGLENASLSNLGLNEADSLAISNEEVWGRTSSRCLFCWNKKQLWASGVFSIWIWADDADNYYKIPGLSSGEFRCLLVLQVMEINVPWPRIYLVSYLGVSGLPSWQGKIYPLLCKFTASKGGFCHSFFCCCNFSTGEGSLCARIISLTCIFIPDIQPKQYCSSGMWFDWLWIS